MESKSRTAAEARFQKAQRPQEAANAWTQYETEERALAARTARLKEERLARDAESGAAAKKTRTAKKPAARKGVGSY